MQIVGHFSDVAAGRAAMGIDWMTGKELVQAIPPRLHRVHRSTINGTTWKETMTETKSNEDLRLDANQAIDLLQAAKDASEH